MNKTWMERAPYILVGGVLLMSFAAFKMVMDPRKVERIEVDYSYEMPRVKAEAPWFSFSGRKIIRKYIGFDEEAQVAAAAPAGEAAKTATAISATGKDTKVAGKDDKKDAKKDAKKNKKNAQKKKPKVEVIVNSNGDEYDDKLSDFADSDNTAEGTKGAVAFAPVNAQNRAGTVVSVEAEEEKLSAQQWRSILFAQPSASNVAKFVEAYKTKKIDEASFYQIAGELFVDTAADRQKAGLDMFKATPSVKSFTFLLSQVQENTPEAQRSEIMTVLKSYSEVAKFGVLNQLLYSSDARVVQTAQSLISQALAKLQKQAQGSGRGEIRSPGSEPAPVAAFNNFVAGLKRLVASNNQTIAASAQTLLDAIAALKGGA